MSPELLALKGSLPYRSEGLEDDNERSSDLIAGPSRKCSLLLIPVRGGGGIGAVEEISPVCGKPCGNFDPGLSR